MGVDSIILTLAALRSLHQPRIRHHHFVSAMDDHFLHLGRVCPYLDDHPRATQGLEEFCKILLRGPHLPFAQRFSFQIQNAVLTPLVSQIHSYGQTVEIGPQTISPALSWWVHSCHLGI